MDLAWMPLPLAKDTDPVELVVSARALHDSSLAGDVLRFRGRPVYSAHRDICPGVPGLLWHLISTGASYPREHERAFSKSRAARIAIIPALFAAADEGKAIWWHAEHPRGRRIYLSPFDFSYVIVLGCAADHYVFITAYDCRGAHEVRKLRRQYLANLDQASS